VRNKDIDILRFHSVGFLTHSRKLYKYTFFCIFMYADDVIGELRRMQRKALLSPLEIIQTKQVKTNHLHAPFSFAFINASQSSLNVLFHASTQLYRSNVILFCEQNTLLYMTQIQKCLDFVEADSSCKNKHKNNNIDLIVFYNVYLKYVSWVCNLVSH
jgi:hypothetical protein